MANERIPIINGSNSSIAKHMRVAAALSIISGVLCERILQPNYVLKHSNELTDVLDELLDDDFSREQHLRAELLALNVERQKENGAVRFEDAVVEIFSCCEIMVLQERHQDFRAALERFCKQVLSKWTEFQSLKERVEPSFNQNCHENWFLLPSPVIQLRNGHTSTKQSNIAPSPGTASGTRGTGHDDVEEAVLSEIKVIVWPCFLLTNIKGYQTISEGFVLSNAQIQEAEDEERTSVTRGPYQFFRRSSKRTRSDFIAVNANGNQAQDDKSFLSGKPSANSNDG